MTDIKNAEAFQTIQTCGSHCSIVVHLKLENIGPLAHLTEYSHYDTFSAEKGVPTVLTNFSIREHLVVDVIDPIVKINKS